MSRTTRKPHAAWRNNCASSQSNARSPCSRSCRTRMLAELSSHCWRRSMPGMSAVCPTTRARQKQPISRRRCAHWAPPRSTSSTRLCPRSPVHVPMRAAAIGSWCSDHFLRWLPCWLGSPPITKTQRIDVMQDERSASDRLKARLTGAVALLILGAVGWFWLLDADSPIDTVAQESAIPAVPEIKPFTVAQPQPPEGIKPVGSEQNAEVVAEPGAPIAVAAAPVAQAESKPVVVEKSVAKPAPAPKPQPAPVPKPQTKPAPEKLQLDTNNLPVAWVVQVGAMSTQAGADKLKRQLLAKG